MRTPKSDRHRALRIVREADLQRRGRGPFGNALRRRRTPVPEGESEPHRPRLELLFVGQSGGVADSHHAGRRRHRHGAAAGKHVFQSFHGRFGTVLHRTIRHFRQNLLRARPDAHLRNMVVQDAAVHDRHIARRLQPGPRAALVSGAEQAGHPQASAVSQAAAGVVGNRTSPGVRRKRRGGPMDRSVCGVAAKKKIPGAGRRCGAVCRKKPVQPLGTLRQPRRTHHLFARRPAALADSRMEHGIGHAVGGRRDEAHRRHAVLSESQPFYGRVLRERRTAGSAAGNRPGCRQKLRDGRGAVGMRQRLRRGTPRAGRTAAAHDRRQRSAEI